MSLVRAVTNRGMGAAAVCLAPVSDATVTTGWSCAQWPQYPNLVFQNNEWQCTDGKILANPTYTNLASPFNPACWSSIDWRDIGILAAELLLLPGWWKLD